MLCAFVLGTAAPVAAQGPPTDDAGPSVPTASPEPPPPPNPLLVPTATASSTTNDKPARGPAVRERGGRRSRAGSSASGFLFLAILVGAMGYYVVKKLRR
jgi:hypothetical protein